MHNVQYIQKDEIKKKLTYTLFHNNFFYFSSSGFSLLDLYTHFMVFILCAVAKCKSDFFNITTTIIIIIIIIISVWRQWVTNLPADLL
jgi:hypothetical protein